MIVTPEQQPDMRAMPLREWRCSGRRRDGRPCNQVLAEYATDGHIVLRKRCDKCGAWNTIQR
jgi:phage FluMu protein Com